MLHQISLKLHKLLEEMDETVMCEHITLLDQIICTRRQSTFEILGPSKQKLA